MSKRKELASDLDAVVNSKETRLIESPGEILETQSWLLPYIFGVLTSESPLLWGKTYLNLMLVSKSFRKIMVCSSLPVLTAKYLKHYEFNKELLLRHLSFTNTIYADVSGPEWCNPALIVQLGDIIGRFKNIKRAAFNGIYYHALKMMFYRLQKYNTIVELGVTVSFSYKEYYSDISFGIEGLTSLKKLSMSFEWGYPQSVCNLTSTSLVDLEIKIHQPHPSIGVKPLFKNRGLKRLPNLESLKLDFGIHISFGGGQNTKEIREGISDTITSISEFPNLRNLEIIPITHDDVNEYAFITLEIENASTRTFFPKLENLKLSGASLVKIPSLKQLTLIQTHSWALCDKKTLHIPDISGLKFIVEMNLGESFPKKDQQCAIEALAKHYENIPGNWLNLKVICWENPVSLFTKLKFNTLMKRSFGPTGRIPIIQYIGKRESSFFL